MVDFIPAEKATPIRYPSTANLMIASQDRNSGNAAQFQLTKSNALMNGFFTRIATSEVTLNWFQPNIYDLSNVPIDTNSVWETTNELVIDISGGTYDGAHIATLPTGFYNVAECLEAIVTLLNNSTAPGIFSLSTSGGVTFIDISGANPFRISGATRLAQMLGLAPVLPQQNTTYTTSQPVLYPDLRSIEYIDFVSNDLTYNQAVKDTSTNDNNKDVLCRWYMAYDEQTNRDSLGFPILMGYEPFTLRRTFNPPKQIRWASNQPIGNLGFELYGQQTFAFQTDYALLQFKPLPINLNDDVPNPTNWLMTLQVSEV